jgi:hypothetical protein
MIICMVMRKVSLHFHRIEIITIIGERNMPQKSLCAPKYRRTRLGGGVRQEFQS